MVERGKNDMAREFPENHVVHRKVWGFAGLPLESP
jgi:hypothetical protein